MSGTILRRRWPRASTFVALATLCSVVLASGWSPAGAQSTELEIGRVQLEPDGASSLVLTVPAGVGRLGPADIRLREDEAEITSLDVQLISEVEAREPVQVAVLMDTSGSTEGAAIEAAKAAASELMTSLVDSGVIVTLIAFADEAQVLAGPTNDLNLLRTAVGGLEAGGDTALNDAVLLAARTLLEARGERRILLFTDGRDEGSATDLATVVDAVRVAELPVTSIMLQTDNTDAAALEAMAVPSGGSVVSVATATELAAAFEQVVLDLPQTYLVTWESQVRNGSELQVSVAVVAAGSELVDTALVLNPRRGTPTPPVTVSLPKAGVFGAGGGSIALGTLGVGLALLLVLVLGPRPARDTKRTLLAAMDARQGRAASRAEKSERKEEVALVTRLAGQAARAVEALPSRSSYDDDLVLRIERAGWSVRPSELQAGRIALGGLFLVMAWGLAQNVAVAAVAAVAGYMVPSILMSRAHDKRQAAFVEQLPVVLQLLAGSLKAGYGIVQAMDLVVEETDAPISEEFSRVVSEHLLGLELEDALEALADRIDSEDLHWVVVAMNVQRKVGGNLADLFETISHTLRDRAMVKRQVRTLAAEGRLSAQVLTALPIGIGGYISVVNPDYIAPLFSDRRGNMMVAGAVMLMLVGAFWMRKLIDMDV